MARYKFALVAVTLMVSLSVFGQVDRLAGQVRAYQRLDSLHPPGKDFVLLVGSSSFTNWKDVQTYFPEKRMLNRGFGGSTLVDLAHYQEELIFAYKPKQIIIYCGENDFGASDTVSVTTVVQRFKSIFQAARKRHSKAKISFISMKPSPRRKHLMNKMALANHQIAKYLKTQKRTSFIDVYHLMLDERGEPIQSLFLADRLHMNATGYQIWKKAIRPHLK